MKALVVGYGSIGRRHARILQEQLNVQVEIVTRSEDCKYPHYPSFDKVGDLDRFDYFVIATDTGRHYQNLIELDAAVSNRIFLVEKPLFYLEDSFFNARNIIYVGYNLRFHPALQKSRDLLKQQKISFVNTHVGGYLPWWRPGTDYSLCYSANRENGGGVVFDLSHEIDYLQWLFGPLDSLISLTTRLSNLEIDSDDYSTVLGVSNTGIPINLTMDYLSMISVRSMLACGDNLTLQLDLTKGIVSICDTENRFQKWDFPEIERDFTYREMHSAIINNKTENVCGLEEALSVMKTIKNIYRCNIEKSLYKP